MSTGKRRIFSREVKLSAIQRVLTGESGAAVCRELKIGRSHLSMWCAQYRRHGPEGLRLARRPFKVPGAVELDPIANSIFFDEPCGTSGKHAGRATGLA